MNADLHFCLHYLISGRYTWKVEPLPTVLSAEMSPPWFTATRTTNALTMGFFSRHNAMVFIANLECMIGMCFLTGIFYALASGCWLFRWPVACLRFFCTRLSFFQVRCMHRAWKHSTLSKTLFWLQPAWSSHRPGPGLWQDRKALKAHWPAAGRESAGILLLYPTCEKASRHESPARTASPILPVTPSAGQHRNQDLFHCRNR